MRLLITGALGHIGSRLIRTLTPGEFDEVVLLDNLSTQRYCTLFDLPKGVRFRFIEADIRSADLVRLFDGSDAVIHLAAITNAADSFSNAEQVEQVNYEGTQRVADACAATGARLVFISTTSVYGTQEQEVDENCSLDELKPQSPYADSKLRAEQYLQGLGAQQGLRFVVCRFGTIYGISPGMRFHTAINKFVWQAVMGQSLTVWRTALNQQRPYLDLADGVRALDFILKTDRFDQQVYNVLTENATVGEIVEIIRAYVDEVRVEYVDSKIMNQLSYIVSSHKFRQLGFNFEGGLEHGISDTVRLLDGIRADTWSKAPMV
jgi:nucleoside-diphosphate-sugar epimerase